MLVTRSVTNVYRRYTYLKLLLYFFFFYLARATFWFLSNILHCWSFARGLFFSATVRVYFLLRIIGTVGFYSYRLPNPMIGTSKDKSNTLKECYVYKVTQNVTIVYQRYTYFFILFFL